MSDSDYIPAEERDNIMGWFQRQPSGIAWDKAGMVHDSHDVADSVMRELAEALRVALDANGCPGLETEPGAWSGCTAHETGATDCPTCGALSRFDALGGNDE